MKKTKLFLFFIVCKFVAFGQADIHFSQFYETSILRNPALTGIFADDYKFGVYYRNQWSSITFPYQTILASAETRLEISHSSEDFVSFGILGFSDKAGSLDQRITTFYPAINYNKSINAVHHTYLSVGFTGGYIQYSFDPSKATFNNQYLNGAFDPNNPSLEIFPNSNMSFWDVGAGVNLNSSLGQENTTTYMVGVSGYHFTQPNFSYYKIPNITLNMRWNANFALSFEINQNLNMQIQSNYASQGTYSEIMLGSLLNWNVTNIGASPVFTLSLGAFYRYNDAIIPVVKLKYLNMALGISYDVNVSTLKEASNMRGGYETTLFLTGLFSRNSGASQKMVCPRF